MRVICRAGNWTEITVIIPKLIFFFFSYFMSDWYCIDIVRRNSVLVTHGSLRVKDQCEIYILSERITNMWITLFFSSSKKFGFHSSNLFIKGYDNSMKKQFKNNWFFHWLCKHWNSWVSAFPSRGVLRYQRMKISALAKTAYKLFELSL